MNKKTRVMRQGGRRRLRLGGCSEKKGPAGGGRRPHLSSVRHRGGCLDLICTHNLKNKRFGFTHTFLQRKHLKRRHLHPALEKNIQNIFVRQVLWP